MSEATKINWENIDQKIMKKLSKKMSENPTPIFYEDVTAKEKEKDAM